MNNSSATLDQTKLDDTLKGFNIPAQPRVLLAVQQERSKPEPSLVEIAKLVSADVGLAGAVLKTINSPFFGMRRPIESINQAVMLLGMTNVVNLVTGYALRNSMQGKCAISLERFWDVASEVANISAAITKTLKLPVTPDEAYMLGLFIDCGIPVLACKFDDYKQVLIEGNDNPDVEMTVIEDRHYSTNHAIIGFYTSRSWGLPEAIRQAILQHHDTLPLYRDDSDEISFLRDNLIAIQKMAENISHNYRRLSEDLAWKRTKESVLNFIGIDEEQYLELREDIHEILRQN